jgi:hypothetical protein
MANEIKLSDGEYINFTLKPFKTYSGWCFKGLGMVRTEPEYKDETVGIDFGSSFKFMIKNELDYEVQNSHYCMLIGFDGFDIQHSTGSGFAPVFSIEDKYIGTKAELRIFFGDSIRKVGPWERSLYNYKSVTVDIPDLKKYDTTCTICLDDTEGKEEILSCGHQFHSKCLWEYYQKNNLVRKSPCREKGSKYACGHGDYIKEEKCPINCV